MITHKQETTMTDYTIKATAPLLGQNGNAAMCLSIRFYDDTGLLADVPASDGEQVQATVTDPVGEVHAHAVNAAGEQPLALPVTQGVPVPIGCQLEPHVPAGPFDDDFDGPFSGYDTINPTAHAVMTDAGRYRADIAANPGNITTWYSALRGRADIRAILAFPFEIEAYGIGVGASQDPTAPPPGGYFGAGLFIIDETLAGDYQFVAFGNFTRTRAIESKYTVNGVSRTALTPPNVLAATRADMRVVANSPTDVQWFWRDLGETDWNPVQMPAGALPAFGSSVGVGLMTMAYQENGLPIVGTCDGIARIA